MAVEVRFSPFLFLISLSPLAFILDANQLLLQLEQVRIPGLQMPPSLIRLETNMCGVKIRVREGFHVHVRDDSMRVQELISRDVVDYFFIVLNRHVCHRHHHRCHPSSNFPCRSNFSVPP